MLLRNASSSEYDEIYKHMKHDFPENELPPYSAVIANLKNGVYSGIFLTGRQDSGYAIVTAPVGNEFALINFFAIFPKFRSQGHGSEFLRLICERYSEYKILLEAEDPAAAKNEAARITSKRRLKFYELAGFQILPTARARIFGVDMVIMTNSKESIASVKKAMHSLYRPTFRTAKWLRFINIKDLY